jgi:hypothetical protein
MERSSQTPYMFRALKLARGLCRAFGHKCKRGHIAFCIGTGGTGKSSLAEHIANTVFGDPSAWAIGLRPVLLVEADTVEQGYFTMKSLIQSLLCAVHDPFRASIPEILGWSIDEKVKQALIKALEGIDPLDSAEPAMRTAFIELAKLMQVKLIIIDESNLLVITKRTRRPTDYIESLRRLGDRIGCAILLLGTVDMLELMGYSGQVSRRTLKVHLDRIKCDDEAGKDEFVSFLHSLEEDYSLVPGFLTSRAPEIYACTYGIPGEVVGLVENADTFREALEEPALKWEHVLMAMHHPVEVERLRWEADLISDVMRGRRLTQTEIKEIERRRKVRMNPRRNPVGTTE